MRHEEGFLRGVRGARLYHQGWLPEGEAKAAILVVHGLAEHSGRYMNLVNRFVPLGYAVYGLDHLGHGKSEGRRLFVERFSDFIEPLKTYLGMVRNRQPERPVFLVGHSMGGLIASALLIDDQTGLTGAILSGPAVKPPGAIPAVKIFAGRVLSVLFPRVGVARPDTAAVSRDPHVVEAYLADPLIYKGKMTVRLGAEMVDTMAQVRRDAGRITLPILIVQGGADRLVDPTGAGFLADKIGSSDKKLIVYEGLYHEVFNEPEHDRVLTDVEQWLEMHLP